MSAATVYAACHDSAAAQQSRISGPDPLSDPWGSEVRILPPGPNRDPEPNLRIISSYLRPGGRACRGRRRGGQNMPFHGSALQGGHHG